MDLRLLGPLEVWSGDRSLALGARQQRALLAMLLLRANRVVALDELVDQLWPGQPPTAATNIVQTYVSRLRRVLAEAPDGAGRIVTRDPGYLFLVDAGELDADRFETGVAEGRSRLQAGDPTGAAACLRAALAEWRGPVLEAFAYEPFVEVEAARLERLRFAAVEDRIAADLALGREAEVADELAELVAAEPLRERLWELRLDALAKVGRRAEALEAYERLRTILRDELDVGPGAGIEARVEAIREGAVVGPSPSMPSPPPNHRDLPISRTSFVGRDRELGDAEALLETEPLLTLVGAAGCGKTRLATEVARVWRDRTGDAAILVELAGLTDPSHLPNAIASAIGLHLATGVQPSDALLAALRPRSVLLVLDNCEHLVDEVAALTARLLETCPAIRIVATSQEPLGVPGERVFPVAPLGVPTLRDLSMTVLLETPASRLFIDRAVAASPAFEVTPADEPVLARICARLDGIPLAIELAATRVRLLSLTEIERRLDDRFALLSTGRRSGDARHRTLEATIAWSYDLLSDAERSLLERLSVFAGGFSLEAVEAIGPTERDGGGETVAALGRLVDRSLVARTQCPDAGAVRFGLLETIRAYAAARLAGSGEVEAIRTRHARYFTTLAETASASLRGPGQSRWLTRLRLEQDNIRASIAWAIEAGDRETALRLAYALWLYWELDGSPAEGVRWLEAALESVAAVPDALRAKACVAAGFMALDIAEHARAMEHALTALEISERTRDEHGVALAGHLLGAVAMFTGDQARASVALEGALERFRELGDPLNVAWTLHHLGQLYRMQGRFEAARAAHEESLELYRREGAELRVAFALWRLGIVAGHLQDDATAAARCAEALALFTEMDDVSGIAHVTATMGELARIGGDIAAATEAYRRSLTMFRGLCDRRCVASSLKNLGVVARARGEAGDARALYEESLQLRIEMDDPAGIAECLAGLAGLELAADRAESAARLLGAAAAIREALGAAPWMGDLELLEADEIAVAGALGPERYAAAVAWGRDLPVEQAAALALGGGVATGPS